MNQFIHEGLIFRNACIVNVTTCSDGFINKNTMSLGNGRGEGGYDTVPNMGSATVMLK